MVAYKNAETRMCGFLHYIRSTFRTKNRLCFVCCQQLWNVSCIKLWFICTRTAETAEMESEAHTRNYTVFSFLSLSPFGQLLMLLPFDVFNFFFLSFIVFNRLNQRGMPPKLHVKRPNARADWRRRKRREKKCSSGKERRVERRQSETILFNMQIAYLELAMR